MAYAWDLETNTRQTKVFSVPHKRFTKSGSYNLTDPRDIYEMVANNGARRLRACILGVIPGDIIDKAVDECNATLLSDNSEGPLEDRIRKMVLKFSDIDWSDADVWEFIRARKLLYCCLYDQGRSRIGCLFCPMAKPRERQADLARYPKYAAAFRKAFQRLFDARKATDADWGGEWSNGGEMFDWWINEYRKQEIDGGLFT